MVIRWLQGAVPFPAQERLPPQMPPPVRLPQAPLPQRMWHPMNYYGAMPDVPKPPMHRPKALTSFLKQFSCGGQVDMGFRNQAAWSSRGTAAMPRNGLTGRTLDVRRGVLRHLGEEI